MRRNGLKALLVVLFILGIGLASAIPSFLTQNGIPVSLQFQRIWFSFVFSILTGFSGALSLVGFITHIYLQYYTKKELPLPWPHKTDTLLFWVSYLLGYILSVLTLYSWIIGNLYISVFILLPVLILYLKFD